jgi:hypothetical protein
MSGEEPILGLEAFAAMYEECGVDPEVALAAARLTRRRLAERPPVGRAPGSMRERVRAALGATPVGSFRRIVGLDERRIPFLGTDGALDPTAFTRVLEDAGLEADVALAFAKVMVAAHEPEGFFAPVWAALGAEGPVRLAELRDLDWRPLRPGVLPRRAPGRAATADATTVDATAIDVTTVDATIAAARARPRVRPIPRARPRSVPGPRRR